MLQLHSVSKCTPLLILKLNTSFTSLQIISVHQNVEFVFKLYIFVAHLFSLFRFLFPLMGGRLYTCNSLHLQSYRDDTLKDYFFYPRDSPACHISEKASPFYKQFTFLYTEHAYRRVTFFCEFLLFLCMLCMFSGSSSMRWKMERKKSIF